MSRRLPNSGFLASNFTQTDSAATEVVPTPPAVQSGDNGISKDQDSKRTFETVDPKKSNIVSMTGPSSNICQATTDDRDKIIPEPPIESATVMQKLSVHPESKESKTYALQPAAIPSNEPLVGYLYSDKAFCSTSDSGESTSEDEGVAHGSYDVAGAASASSDEERPPRYSDVFVVNPADSSSDVEDNADSSGLECSDGEPPLTAVEQLNNQINAEIADHSQYDPDDAYFQKLKEKEKLDEALPAELKDADDLIIPYGDPYIGIYDDSKQFKKCTDFKRFCDANMLHAEAKPVDADKIVFACSDITNFAVGFDPETRRAEEKLFDRESPDPKQEKENEIAGGETKVKAEGVIVNRFPDGSERAGEKESETPRNPAIGPTDDLSDASKFSFDDSGDSEGRESPPPTDRRPRTNADLLRGIERTISELLIKENSLAFGDGDRAEKLSPVTSDEEGERAARSAGCGQRPASSDGATGTPVESPRSARADRCAPYTSRVMITQESSPSQVSVITSDTTRLMADVTVQHTNSQNENDKYRRFARDDEFEEREADSEGGHGGVRVVTNADTLSAVVCLEEGLADDDSWVEEADSTPSESDSGDDAAFEREEDFSAYRRQALDFTLHTIVEESCEESEPERTERKARPVSATELEKYFFFGLGDGRHASEAGEDVHSETSSACSEGGDSPAGDELAEPDERHDVERLASSRLEKYFLSGFMGFDRERRDSDGSGSVGSDSEGRHSPEQRKKRLVRARGTGRSHSSSLDNLLSGSEMQLEQQNDAASDSEGSSTETETYNDTSIDSQGDGSKRKKQGKKVRSSPGDERKHSTESRDEPSTRDDARSISEGEEDGSVTPQPEFLPLGSDLSNSKKQTSRDSGFVGSCDDLLKNDVGADGHVSKPTDLKLDLEEIVEENKLDSDDKSDLIRLRQYPQTALMRKDSFNNWSSDEETNLMMNRMRQFFKTMVVAAQPPTEDPAPGSKPTTPSSNRTSLGPRPRRTAKPPQLVYFESELTRLMKTVPGIRDEEVKEIVEYLSSEDTWSDSYDSSDYTSSDVEGVGGGKAALQRQISESCKEIIDKFDRVEEASEIESPCAADHPNFGRDTAYVYQKLVASLNKISTEAEGREPSAGSPHGSPLVTKVIRHIGSRLVALMHEVSSGESGASASPRMRAPRRPRPASASTTEDDDSASDAGARAALPRSKSHDVLAHETQRGRGAEERDEREASDCDRFSWRGSFESALLAADSRGALATEAAGQRRSAGDLLAAQRSQSRSCGAIGGSEDRLWRGRRRSSAPDAAPEDEEERPRATGSLPRLPSGAAPVKSARYRPPGFTRAQRAVSAPGLHAPRAPRRRPPPPAPIVASPASAQSLQDEIYTAEILTATPRATLPRRSNSPAPHHEQEDDLDRLVGLHHNRSGLHGRSESMASVYSGAGDGARGSVTVRGAAQFSLLYNYRQGALEVGVRRCRDLAPVDVKRNRSDPYVKVYLLPDKSKCGKRKTKVKKNTLNPIFDETLRFVQPLSALSGRTLWLSVWHADMFGRNDFLGEVTLPLGDIVFDDPTPKWYNLQERTEQFEEHHGTKGDLIVGLKFELPDQNASPNNRTKGTLHVLVKEAKNLCASKPNGLADAFCKSYLLPERGRGAKQKTAVSRRTLSPRWETCFTYRALSLSDLQQRALELSVWDRDLLSSNDFMGGVRFSLGTGTYLGANVDWMDSMGKELTLWQTMMQRPNFWVEGSVPLRSSLSN